MSVFSGRESTSFHFGPLRLTLRVLCNLAPAATDRIFVECGKVKNIWYENPLFIFDDTLMHQSFNETDKARYCLFVDIIRPTHFPGAMKAVVSVIRVLSRSFNYIFYSNWKVIDR